MNWLNLTMLYLHCKQFNQSQNNTGLFGTTQGAATLGPNMWNLKIENLPLKVGVGEV
jgi:hypothetical protein